MNLGNYTSESLDLKTKSYFFDPLMIFIIYGKTFLASRLRDRNSIFFILCPIELDFFVVISGITWVNFVVLVHIKIRTFLLMILSKKHFFVDYSVGELSRDPTYLRGKTREIELVMSLTSCQGILTSFLREKFMSLNWLRLFHQIILV